MSNETEAELLAEWQKAAQRAADTDFEYKRTNAEFQTAKVLRAAARFDANEARRMWHLARLEGENDK